MFGEGQGNEGSDKCSRVVQLDATGGKETRFSVTPALSKLISPRRMKIDLFFIYVRTTGTKFGLFNPWNANRENVVAGSVLIHLEVN